MPHKKGEKVYFPLGLICWPGTIHLTAPVMAQEECMWVMCLSASVTITNMYLTHKTLGKHEGPM